MKTKLGKNKEGYILRFPDSIINQMSWKIGDVLVIVPIQEKKLLITKEEEYGKQ